MGSMDVLEVSYSGLSPETAWHVEACQRADLLHRAHPELQVCRVSVDLREPAAARPARCAVRIDATVPGHELTVSRVRSEDPLQALDRAFEGVQQQIDELQSERCGGAPQGRQP
jgi:hypothetical protein